MDKFCELAMKYVYHLKQVVTPCIDNHHLKKDDFQVVGELVVSAHISFTDAKI